MVLSTIFFLTMTFSVLFIIIGALLEKSFQDNNIGIFLGLAGFLIMMVLGISMLGGSSLEYKEGYGVVEQYSYQEGLLVNTSSIVTNNYVEYEGYQSWLLEFIIFLTGLAGLSSTIVYFNEKKKSKEENFEYDD